MGVVAAYPSNNVIVDFAGRLRSAFFQQYPSLARLLPIVVTTLASNCSALPFPAWVKSIVNEAVAEAKEKKLASHFPRSTSPPTVHVSGSLILPDMPALAAPRKLGSPSSDPVVDVGSSVDQDDDPLLVQCRDAWSSWQHASEATLCKYADQIWTANISTCIASVHYFPDEIYSHICILFYFLVV